MIRELKLPMKVVFVDTGVHFAETLSTRDRIANEYQLEIVDAHAGSHDGRANRPHGSALPLERGARTMLSHAEDRAAVGDQRAVRRFYRQLAAFGGGSVQNAPFWLLIRK